MTWGWIDGESTPGDDLALSCEPVFDYRRRWRHSRSVGALSSNAISCQRGPITQDGGRTGAIFSSARCRPSTRGRLMETATSRRRPTDRSRSMHRWAAPLARTRWKSPTGSLSSDPYWSLVAAAGELSHVTSQEFGATRRNSVQHEGIRWNTDVVRRICHTKVNKNTRMSFLFWRTLEGDCISNIQCPPIIRMMIILILITVMYKQHL